MLVAVIMVLVFRKNSFNLILRANSVRSLCNSYSSARLLVGQKVRPRSKIFLSDLDSVLDISMTLLLHGIGELDSTFCSGTGIMLLLPVLWELDSTV